jgi:hypothetical protein
MNCCCDVAKHWGRKTNIAPNRYAVGDAVLSSAPADQTSPRQNLGKDRLVGRQAASGSAADGLVEDIITALSRFSP